ncbi:MAG TPA: hypothetical protein ENN73_02510 [Firmicutes bacterium]|nr:hypothetical protein [Bacillota bacterium]
MKKKFSLVLIICICIVFLSCGSDTEEYRLETEKREECSQNLRDIGNAVFSYKLSNKTLPDNLEQLVEGKFIRSIPKCPVSEGKYTYEKKGSGFRISCPNPELHVGLSGMKSRLKKLYYDTDKVVQE